MNEGVEKFVEYLNTCEPSFDGRVIASTICKNGFPFRALAAVLEKSSDPTVLQSAVQTATFYHRLDLVSALAENGYSIFVDFRDVLGNAIFNDNHMGLIKLYSELEANFNYDIGENGIHHNFFGYTKIVSEHEIKLFYFLIGQGYGIKGYKISQIIFNLELDPDDFFSRHDFAHFLLQRTEIMWDFATMLNCAVRFKDRTLIERLLELPQVSLYLQMAKHVLNVLLEKNEAILVQCLEPTSKESAIFPRIQKMQREMQTQLVAEFKSLVKGENQQCALLEPLTMEELQLIVDPQSNFRMRVLVFLLEQAHCARYELALEVGHQL